MIVGQGTGCLTPGQRLKRARSRKGLTIAQLSEQTGIGARAIRAHESDQNGIRPETAEIYARTLNVPPEQILYGRSSAQHPVRLVPVLGDVQAGVWQTLPDEPPEPQEWVPLSDPTYFRAENVYALNVRGPSMNKIYGDPAKVIVVDAVEAGIREGDHVVVQRREHDKVETTLKELVLNGRNVELWPRSTDPNYQTPIILQRRKHSDQGVSIIAVVVGAYKPGPTRIGQLVW